MASAVRRLRARILRRIFALHARIYQSSGGRLGAWIGGPMLLLTTTGRRSGEPRTTPLLYFRDGPRWVVVGSDGGSRKDPNWVRNLRADPRCRIRIGRRELDVRGHVATGAERSRLWAKAITVNPLWRRYQHRTSRELPVIVLARPET